MGHERLARARVVVAGVGPESVAALAESGAAVERATGDWTALESLDDPSFDCAVVGHDPPETDGLAASERLREHRPALPVVFHPEEGSEGLAAETIDAGVDSYVPGDAGPDSLVRAVERAAGSPGERVAYREVFEHVDVGLTVRDADTGELLDVNEHYCDLLGYPREEAMELDLAEVTADVPGYDPARAQELLARAVEDPSFTFEWPDRTKGGDVVWVEVDATVTSIEGRERLLVTVRDVSDRREREHALETLHEAAARLGDCDTVASACEATVEVASEVLDPDACAVLVAEGEWLVPKAVSSGASEGVVRRIRPGEGLAGETFRTGQPRLVDDVAADRTADRAGGRYRSGVGVPVGGTAVFRATATEPAAFSQSDLEMAELLVAHTARALDRIRYEAELERQNERLEEFAGVVSHDLRNPLNVAQARLEIAGGPDRSEDLAAVDRALSRMSAIIDDTLTLARQERGAVDPDRVDLATFARRCWGLVETGRGRLETVETFEFRADPDRLSSLFENLYRNCVEHGTPDARGEAEPGEGQARAAGPTVRVGTVGREGFYVADDGPGIPAAERERVFDTGYTTTREGTGFGLAIVREVAEAHGWDVSVTESRAGGARFEVTGVEPAD